MKRLALLGVLGTMLWMAGCGDSDENPAGSGGKSSAAGAPSTSAGAGKGGSSEPMSDAGASDDAATPGEGGAAGAIGAAGEGGANGDTPDAQALYAVSVLVFNPDNSSTTYVDLIHSLDVATVGNANGREFANQADIATYDGYLYVSSGEAPTITRYSISDAGSWTEAGTISFANYGLTDAPVRDSVNTFISSTKAYMTDPLGGEFIWNPTTMEIIGHIAVPDLTRDNMTLDGSSSIVRGNRLYRTVFWEDWSTYTFSDEQYLITFDLDKDELLTSTPLNDCPNLGAVAFLDEKDVVYFSNWFYNVPGTLLHDKPKSCAVRLLPGQDTVDPDWKLVFSDVTGHEGAQLSYIGNRHAVFAAYHEEDGGLTPDMDPSDIPNDPNWEVWDVNLDSLEAASVTGIDRIIASQSVFTVDQRALLFAPTVSYESSDVYFVKNGAATPSFSIDGYSRGFVKVR